MAVRYAAAALVAVPLAWHAAVDSWVANARTSDPAAVLRQRPDDAVALGRLVDRRLQRTPDALISDNEAARARASLAVRPLSRTSLRIIGLWAAQRHDPALAGRAMMLSDRVSRRDAPTQFWMIEQAVQRGDVAAALAHYHAVMSVQPRTRTELYPVLTGALASADIRRALAPYIARQTNWAVDLIGFAINSGEPRDVAALLFPIAPALRRSSFAVTNALLISRLTDSGAALIARSFVRALWPDIAPETFAQFAVSSATTDRRLASFGWSLNSVNGVTAVANDKGGFDVEADPLTSGTAASRTLLVRPGTRYMFEQVIGRSNNGSAPTLTWRGYCRSSAGERVAIFEHAARAESEPKRDQISFAVPAACPAVEFVLSANGSDGQTVEEVSLTSLYLRPA
ncbi:hypothetical protein [Sphingomonas sp. DT-51]|uniref:hypothetical protein n=1 Tax=Sphingomonas sp. DT-51 TaxID=3396165 RepID=UPI003F5403ED